MEISSSGTVTANLGKAAALSALKNARDLPGKAALQIIESVANPNQGSGQRSGSIGRNLNVKA